MTFNLGQYAPGSILDFKWATFSQSTGQSLTRTTIGTMSVYKDNSATQSTAGITDTVDFDSVTGIHHCRIDTSADPSFYTAGSSYQVVIAGTVVNANNLSRALAHFRLTAAAEAENAIIRGAAVAGTLSTTQMTCDLAETTNTHYVGRRIIWTTGALAGQEAQITAFQGFAAGSSKLTYTATTEAPAAGDKFVIV